MDVKSGVNLAVFGGGLAASVQFPKENVEGLIPDSYKDNIELNKDAFQKVNCNSHISKHSIKFS